MEKIPYDHADDDQPEDKFAPITENCMHLPKEVIVKFIGSEQDVENLHSLLGKPYIGIDVEWLPDMSDLDLIRPALL